MTATSIIYNILSKSDNWEEVYKKIANKEEIEHILETPSNFVSIIDERYPTKLKQCYKPPFGYYQFNTPLDNDSILLFGDDELGIDHDRIIRIDVFSKTITQGDKVLVRGFYEEDLIKLALAFTNKMVITNTINEKGRLKFYINCALSQGADIYVKPTEKPSENNNLIKQGAYLIDQASDID